MARAGELTGRKVLITGASSGLGQHFARLCAAHGAQVAVAARRSDRLRALLEELPADSGRAHAAVELDVCDADAVRKAVRQTAETLGGLDILVNNAGTARSGSPLNQTINDFDAVMDVNLRGVWLMAAECGRYWREKAVPGNIINIASVLGERVASGVAAYCVSKAGVVQMTKAFALDLARHDIRVNALAPGYFETEINAGFFETDAGKQMIKRIPMRRIGNFEDLNGPFLLLASDASRYMTGAIMPVDGGHLVSSM